MSRYGTAVPLGSGSFAEVFRCFDSEMQRPVALKFLRWNEPATAERMFREARAQAKVDHIGVCKVYDTGWQDGRPFIAMQYVEGDDLATAARELSIDQRLELMIDVVEAVQAAHDRGLVHRDLKPENILVERRADGSLQPVVVDFGLVYDRDGSKSRMTRRGEPLGTPAFMAPEQAAGRLDEIDVRTDVYGLGVTLYSILTGELPFDGRGTTDLLIRVLDTEPVPPRKRLPSLPSEIEQIVLKCLEKERRHRYATARELGADLRRFLDGEPVLASHTGWWLPLCKRARRHGRALTMVAVVGGVALVALGGFAWQARQAADRASAEQRFVQISNDLDWAFRAAQMSSTHDITPSRERLQRRIGELERELDELDSAGRGPAHYAVGRAYAALGDDDAARRHLETAWQLGYQTPEVGYFLGLVLGRQYEDGLDRVRHVAESEVQQIYIDELVSRYRDPAKGYLETGREAEAVSVDYVEALIDFYEERYDEALHRLADVQRRLPWFYEASLAEGKVLRRMAEARFVESDIEPALELYGRAADALRRAMASAASDPQIYHELCRVLSRKIEAELDWSIAPSAEAWEDHLGVCEAGLDVDPSSSRAHRVAALAYELKARLAVDHSWNPAIAADAVQRAATLAAEAVRLDPSADAYEVLATVQMTDGRLATVLGSDLDPLASFQAAGRSLERALALTEGPKDTLRKQTANNQRMVAGLQSLRWQPADAAWERTITLLRDELERAPRSFTLWCEVGDAELSLALELRNLGRSFDEVLDRAEQSYLRCMELNEKYHWAFIGQAEVLNARQRQACSAGRYDTARLARARELMARVSTLDEDFVGGSLRQATYWSTEVLCDMAAGRPSGESLSAVNRWVDDAAERGLAVDGWRMWALTLELRGLLVADPPTDRRALREALSRWRPSTQPLSADAVQLGLVRLDHLLWVAEAAWELGDSTEPMHAEAAALLEQIGQFGDGAIRRRPPFEARAIVLDLQQRRGRQGVRASVSSDVEAALRAILARQSTLAVNLQPWLVRLEIVSSRHEDAS